MSEFNRPTIQTTTQEKELYVAAWNSALEMAAYKVENEFVKAFGKDTLSSMAIYIRSLKK